MSALFGGRLSLRLDSGNYTASNFFPSFHVNYAIGIFPHIYKFKFLFTLPVSLPTNYNLEPVVLIWSVFFP